MARKTAILKWEDQKAIIAYFDKNERYDLSLLVFLSFHTGMRIGNILQLRWEDICGKKEVSFKELRNHNQRTISLSKDVRNYVSCIYIKTGKPPLSQHCFVSQKGCVYSVQRINALLKEAALNCGLKDTEISTHSLRKAFGREVFKRYGNKSLYFLKDFFSQPFVKFTVDYLSISSKRRITKLESL